MDKKTIRDKLCILQNNEIYRVNDVMRFKNDNPVIRTLLRTEEYKNSILAQYLRQRPRGRLKKHYKLMLRCILSYQENHHITPLDQNTLVIHVRAGDAFDTLGIGNTRIAAAVRERVEKHMKQYPNTMRIVIITALHFGINMDSVLYKNNTTYQFSPEKVERNIEALHKFIYSIPYENIDIISNMDIDTDFVLLVTCKHLIRTKGGFSNLVGILQYLHQNKHLPPMVSRQLTSRPYA